MRRLDPLKITQLEVSKKLFIYKKAVLKKRDTKMSKMIEEAEKVFLIDQK